MPAGGAQPGAGRKSKAEEQKTASLARAAIQGKFGSVEAGFNFLLESKSDSLIKFVFEHAFGKPQENVDLSGDLTHTVTYRVIRGTGTGDTSK